MDYFQIRRVPKLLTHGWLRNPQSISDLTLAHTRGNHRAQRDDTTQPSDIFATSRIVILR